jgi:exosortase
MKLNDQLKQFAILGAVVLAAYFPTLAWMYERWEGKDSYYSHGLLVPFICAFLVWQQRKVLAAIHPKPLAWGWALFGTGMAIHAASSLVRVYFTSGFSLLLTIAGLILIFLGREYLKKLWFALSFMIFMVPMPEVAIANISFRLKIFAAQISTKLVNIIGIMAVRDGSLIRTMHADLTVEDPCSGIKSLIALIALGALMAYMSKLSRVKKIVLFASAVPIAVGANIVRIVALVAVSEIYGTKFAMGWFHDMMGVLVFVFAFVGLASLGKMLE